MRLFCLSCAEILYALGIIFSTDFILLFVTLFSIFCVKVKHQNIKNNWLDIGVDGPFLILLK